MKLVEIRELDGPNLFLLAPAIKVEFNVDSEQEFDQAAKRLNAMIQGPIDPPADVELRRLESAARAWISSMHHSLGLPAVPIVAKRLDSPGHVAIAFGWDHRRFARSLAESLAMIATDSNAEPRIDIEQLQELLSSSDTDDSPLWVRNAQRQMPVVGITGTNGKTTTTRLLAHMLVGTGKHVGWSSSSGVYIDGAEVLTGDYSGPSGARRVLLDPVVDVAVLETARGGILLRGIAYESNDVSVFTNVSADHLDLQGVKTVEGIAEVKAVVVRMTKPDGIAVLNAADPLVLSTSIGITSSKLLFSRLSNNEAVRSHLAVGGSAVIVENDELVYCLGDEKHTVAKLDEIPMTFGGRAAHMVENAMAATGAAIGLGLSMDQIASGLRSFRNSPDHNSGRLNVFELGGVTAIMDFAHNEVGLDLLIDFSRHLVSPGGTVTVVIGTAGDRTDQSLQEIGRIAAARADRVIIKKTKKYLRGRTNDEMVSLYQAGIREAGRLDAVVADNELSGLKIALDGARPGDVVAIMCQEHMEEIHALLMELGKPIS